MSTATITYREQPEAISKICRLCCIYRVQASCPITSLSLIEAKMRNLERVH